MSERPKVSVITPTFNRADLLPRAIMSVLSQDFTSLELIIVDDGSTDDTVNVVKQLQARDARIRYLSLSENRGIGFARDVGLEQANGEYIAWIDSDDVWLPGKLSEQVRILDQYAEIDILFTNFVNKNEMTQTTTHAFEKVGIALGMLQTRRCEDDVWVVVSGMERALLRKMLVQLGTVLFRSDIVERIGSMNPTLRGAQDLEYCWRAAVLGCRFAYSTKPTQVRHVTGTSITAQKEKSIGNTLNALQVCRGTAKALERRELIRPIRNAELRNWRNLIWTYGRAGLRGKSISTFLASLRTGFSIHNLAFLLIAMGGSRVIELAQGWLRLQGVTRT